jgi:hypothetical protein
MKKILLISFILLPVFVLPLATLAQTTGGAVPESCNINRTIKLMSGTCPQGAVSIEEYGLCCLLNTLYNITDWIFLILVALAGLFVIIGAMTLLTAAGDPTKVASGRNYILYAMIGLLIAFLAKAVPSIVRMIMGAQ